MAERTINEILEAIEAGDLMGDSFEEAREITKLCAALSEARDIVECVADGLKREPRQLQVDAIALLKKWDEHE